MPVRRLTLPLVTVAALSLVALPAHADTPTPSGPTTTSPAAASPTIGSPEATGAPSPGSPTPDRSTDPVPGPPPARTSDPTAPPPSDAPRSETPRSETPRSDAPRSKAPRSDAAGPAVTLAVTSQGGPQAGAFWQDLGRFAVSGTTTGVPDGTPVTLSRRVGSGGWTKAAQTTVAGERYAFRLPVQAKGLVTFRAALPGAEGAEVHSPSVTVTVRDATVTLNRPSTTVNSLKNLPVHGAVVPARAGVSVHIDVRRGSGWHQVTTTRTDAKGHFATTVSYGKGGLASHTLRATYHAANRDRWEASGRRSFTRIAVLDPKVSATTSTDVAKTYRRGCPVGPSRLRTIQLNYYGRDKRIHRGVIIIRTDLTQELTRAFGSALKHRYPIAKMNNPNVYGGNDPRQMAADNTSGFNCRKVVGNPYKMSPHSYGIALDVNTVQNPYRDDRGKWWPANGKSYIDRTPKRWGMLTKGSYLTKSLAKDHFFWGGRWYPGRDYQHFEYRR